MNPNSLAVKRGLLEPAATDLPLDKRVQFIREGYYWPDPDDASPDRRVYNQIVSLRDTWSGDDTRLTEDELERRRRKREERKERQRKRSLEGKTDPVDLLSPDQRAFFDRLHESMGVSREIAATIAGDDTLSSFFDAALEVYESPGPIANWIVNELRGQVKDQPIDALPFGPREFARLVQLVDTDEITNRGARTVFEDMLDSGRSPETIVEERNLRQVDDTDALREAIEEIIEAHPDEVSRYRDGEKNLLGFFMGQIMEKTNGSANPELARSLLQDHLET